MTELAIIVAAAENGVIGRGNALPWHIPGDLRHFKRVTMGKPIIMGRKTYESIGKPLPGRTNIVITRNPRFQADGVTAASTLQDALEIAVAAVAREAPSDGVDEVCVIGGAEVYAAALPLADRMYLTRVHASIEGDARLPEIDWAQWREVSCEHHAAQPPGHDAFSIVRYERVVA